MQERSARLSSEVEERRLLTVMFGDMVGSTALSEAIGADSMHELLKLYQRTCTQAVIDNDGVLSSWMGDGFMAQFGYPPRHEDAAVKAVEAGLAVISAVRDLRPEVMSRFGVKLAIRVGIHSGLVVVSRTPGREDDPSAVFFTGETTNIAARIESSAAPNSVSISQATWDLVDGYFDVDPLGPQQLRGLTRKITTFRVRERTNATSRYFARSGRLTPLVGRGNELAEVLDFAGRDPSGTGQIFGLTGDPGMGKTRLLDELIHRAGPNCDVLYTACVERDTTTPLHPFATLIRTVCAPAGGQSQITFENFAGRIRPDVPHATALARLAELAGISLPDNSLPPEATPERVLRETSAAVAEWLRRRGNRDGTVVLVDDAHWLDPSSRDVIIELAGEPGPLRTVLAYRPDPDTGWIPPLCRTTLELQPLSRPDSVELIRKVLDNEDQQVTEAADRSDGVPLFAEELGRAMGSGELHLFGSFPSTLHDLVVSRLDRIPQAKAIAQIGASIGRDFDLDLLAAVSGQPVATVLDQAELLEAARIWQRDRSRDRVRFSFRHALVQDAAYDSQIRDRKYDVHGRLADVMVEQGQTTTASGLAAIAHHLEHAGPAKLPSAVGGWAAAGYATANDGAHVEAVVQFRRGLGLVTRIDDPSVAAELELQLQLGLGASLSTTAGYGHEPVQSAFARAGDLCAMMGNPPELYPAMWGLSAYHLVRGDYAVAEDLARSCSRIAVIADEPALEIESGVGLGVTAFYRGRLVESIGRLQSAIDGYRATPVITPFQRFQHPAVAALSHLALALWLVGETDAAYDAGCAATEVAQSCEQHLRWFAREYSHTFRAALAAYNGDGSTCLRHAQQAIDICNEYGSQMFLAGAEVFKGYGEACLGAVDEGVVRIEAACETYIRTGATLFRPFHLVLLARARILAGNDRGALAALNEAAELAEHTGELVHLPGILVERGRVRRALSEDHAAAEADDRRAVDLANQFGFDLAALGLPTLRAGSHTAAELASGSDLPVGSGVRR
jgi:class 3 adenylate cyclase